VLCAQINLYFFTEKFVFELINLVTSFFVKNLDIFYSMLNLFDYAMKNNNFESIDYVIIVF
jgi:hypothetical protein